MKSKLNEILITEMGCRMKQQHFRLGLLFLLLLGLVCCAATAGALTIDEMPKPAELNTDVAAPTFQMEDVDGTVISSSELDGKPAVIIFGRTNDGLTPIFMAKFTEALSLLKENGVSILVGLRGHPDDADVLAFSEEFGSCRCGRVSDDADNGLTNALESIGYEFSNGIDMPVVFLRDKQNHIRYYSTGFHFNSMREILSIASTALQLAGAISDKSEPAEPPSITISVESETIVIGETANFIYKVNNPDPNGRTVYRLETVSPNGMRCIDNDYLAEGTELHQKGIGVTPLNNEIQTITLTVRHLVGEEVCCEAEKTITFLNSRPMDLEFTVDDPATQYLPGDNIQFSTSVSGTDKYVSAQNESKVFPQIQWKMELVNYNGKKDDETAWSVRPAGDGQLKDISNGSQTIMAQVPSDACSDETIRATFVFSCAYWSKTVVKEVAVTTSKDDAAMAKIKAFVARCYRMILGREADEGGLNSWSVALKNKEAAAANIINGFVKSDEFKNRNLSNDAKVDILYKTMLNREADAGGKAGWVDALGKGYTLQHIINGFCGSDEFAAICKGYEIEPGTVDAGPVTPQADESTPRGKIEAFVKRCYSLILNRDADEGGLKGWSDALEQRTAAAAQIIDGFVRSDEYTNRKLSAGESVDILYNTMLGRAADEGGKAGWVDALGQGFTLQHIINGFCGSAEFTAICDNYGIVAGSVAVSGAVVKREAITPEGDETEAPVVYQGYNSEFINEEKIRAFVEHCYAAVFGREGDAEGVENYTALILNGKKTPKSVAREFVFSAEFQGQLPGNEEFIRILYRLYFDREPGAEELAGWVKMLEDGASLEEIVNGFARSEEFKAIVNGLKE